MFILYYIVPKFESIFRDFNFAAAAHHDGSVIEAAHFSRQFSSTRASFLPLLELAF